MLTGNFPVQLAPPMSFLVSGFLGSSGASFASAAAFPLPLAFEASSGFDASFFLDFESFFELEKTMKLVSSPPLAAGAGFFDGPLEGFGIFVEKVGSRLYDGHECKSYAVFKGGELCECDSSLTGVIPRADLSLKRTCVIPNSCSLASLQHSNNNPKVTTLPTHP